MATGRNGWVGRGLVALGVCGGLGLVLETMPGSIDARFGTSIASAAPLAADWAGVHGDPRGNDHRTGLHLAKAPLERRPLVPVAGDENFWLSASPHDSRTAFPIVIGSRFGVTAPSGAISTFEVIGVEPVAAADRTTGADQTEPHRYVAVLCRDVSPTAAEASARTLRFLVEAGTVGALEPTPKPHAL